MPSMLTAKRVVSWLLVLAIPAMPAMAGSNDAKTASENTGSTTAAASAAANPNPSPTPAIGNANVTALLGVLVMKGVLAPSEANAIRNAAPEAEFQLLVEALSRKGLLSASDMAAVANPAPQPAAAVAAPVPYAAPSSEAYATPLEASVSTVEPEASLATQS